MDISIEYTLASALPEYTSNPDKLAQQLNADCLFQEHNSRHYQRQAGMKSNPHFTHPTYYQHFEGFEPSCCILDLLFQLGPESFKITDEL